MIDTTKLIDFKCHAENRRDYDEIVNLFKGIGLTVDSSMFDIHYPFMRVENGRVHGRKDIFGPMDSGIKQLTTAEVIVMLRSACGEPMEYKVGDKVVSTHDNLTFFWTGETAVLTEKDSDGDWWSTLPSGRRVCVGAPKNFKLSKPKPSPTAESKPIAHYIWDGVQYEKERIDGELIPEYRENLDKIIKDRDELTNEIADRHMIIKRHATLAEARGF